MLGLVAPARAQEASEAALAERLNAIVNEGEAARAFWGIEVYSPARGRSVYSLNSGRYFTPASVTKLFTTAAALALLGPDYRFRTLVGSRARIDARGHLLGHLFFVGGGDPDLAGCSLPYAPEKEKEASECDAAAVLDRLAAQVAEKGVRSIMGDLVIDQSFFAPEPYPLDWTVGDLLWGYAPPVRALSLGNNLLTLRVEPGEQVNEIGRISWQPLSDFYRIQNQVWTAPPGGETRLYVRRDPGSRVLEISGPIALDAKARTLQVAVEEPSEFIGELFRQALARRGIQGQGRVEAQYSLAPPFASEQTKVLPVVLAEHISLPLFEDIRFINKNSQNLHAEMLLRLLGRQQPPEATGRELPRRPGEPPPRRGDGSTEAGLEVLWAWLAANGMNPAKVGLTDGSGISRRNLVTPDAVVNLLRYIETQPWAPLFRDSLPVAGLDGTLKERMRHAPLRGRVRAKTGTLAGTNSLAGYIETLTGETLLFAVFLNHHTLDDRQALALMDRVVTALLELPPP
ncbi:MAG: D-alanyl-D-alanine carboxypeptidase/D-alanyl-D-alanine-endopeptidase, partial [Acidobacteria bacterium]|nr:D-alanyl-D-alanine carboxypeptidase/D-alanyl-D-alanine-endopeptidase [Acidobacteriota bacterium]